MNRRLLLALIAIAAVSTMILAFGPNRKQTAQSIQWNQIWSDEFNGSDAVNGSDWIYDTGTAYGGSSCPANWGTGEVEVMSGSTANVFQSNGNLNIRALHSGGSATSGWTSGRIETVRTDFQPPLGGAMAVEARLQQPNVDTTNGLGYWPAFWMLGGAFRGNCPSWPSIGEIDIMEDINGRSSEFATLHCGSYPGGPCNEPTGLGSGERSCPGCQTGFHIYRVEFDKSVLPEEIRWYLDGTNFFTLKSNQVDATTWNNATNHGFFIIFDLAIGGGFPAAFGGGPTAATISGQSLVVDYIRVYYSSAATPTPTPTPTPSPTPTPTPTPTPVPTPTIFTVNTVQDHNDGVCNVADCSLREAIAAAAPGDLIQFSSLFGTPQTIVLNGTELVINKSLTISGPGASLLTVSGNNTSRVFDINAGFTATLSGITVSNGRVFAPGGGVGNFGGTLNLINMLISGNAALGLSVPNVGSGVYSNGSLNITDSTIRGNNSTGSGAGIYALGSINVTRSTISGNTSNFTGGGLYLAGVNGSLINSTISGNVSGSQGGGLLFYGVIENPTTLQITNCTIVNNNAPNGGGIVVANDSFSPGPTTAIVRNTIIANNTNPNLRAFDGSGAAIITSKGYNLTSDNSNTFLNQPTDQINTDPLLMPLANNGGPTQTHAFFAGSPALDKGDSSGSNTDQRGFMRPVDLTGIPNALGGDGADIGAYEAQSAPTASTPTPTPTPIGGSVQFAVPRFDVIESDGAATVTITRNGDASTAASVSYTTADGTATQKGDYIFAAGTLSFAVGETSKSFTVLIVNDAYQEGTETFGVSLSNPVGTTLGLRSTATVAIFDDDLSPPSANPIDQANFFVREHYYDFLNRLPDAGGLAFWTNEITSCGTDQACIDLKRVNVSAAYFLSIEFQQTGYLVERMYKVAYGDAIGASTFGGAHQLTVPTVRYTEFLTDTQQIGQGVIVGQAGWEQVLANNKQTFAAQFVQRSRFTTALATTLTPAQFVDKLFANAGVTPSSIDRNSAIAEFGSATNTSDVVARARALRDVSENSILNQQEFNRAFVLMQFFGYLRRNPNDLPDSDYTGYDFWLTKLNQFNGNFVAAEMVKAFITSTEYRQRFGP